MQYDRVADLLAECRKQRTVARRWIAASGALLVLLVAGSVYAAVGGRFHGLVIILIPVLLVLNLLRLAQYVTALRKVNKAERLIRQAQARLASG
jgi:hypothetical protein